MALILRSDLDRSLTIEELDGNFTHLDNKSDGFGATGPQGATGSTGPQGATGSDANVIHKPLSIDLRFADFGDIIADSTQQYYWNNEYLGMISSILPEFRPDYSIQLDLHFDRQDSANMEVLLTLTGSGYDILSGYYTKGYSPLAPTYSLPKNTSNTHLFGRIIGSASSGTYSLTVTGEYGTYSSYREIEFIVYGKGH